MSHHFILLKKSWLQCFFLKTEIKIAKDKKLMWKEWVGGKCDLSLSRFISTVYNLNRKTQSSFWVTVWAFHIGFEFLNIVLQNMYWFFDRNRTPGLGFRVGFITRITWSPHLGSGHLLTGHESYAVDWYHWDRRKIVRKLILEQICR